MAMRFENLEERVVFSVSPALAGATEVLSVTASGDGSILFAPESDTAIVASVDSEDLNVLGYADLNSDGGISLVDFRDSVVAGDLNGDNNINLSGGPGSLDIHRGLIPKRGTLLVLENSEFSR